MTEAENDPYGLNDPHNVALRERAVSNKSFATSEERDAYIESWNDKLIDKKIRARAMVEAEKAAISEKVQAVAVASAPPVVEVAHVHKRHWGLVFSFLSVVVLPVILVGFVLVFMSKDQFASTTAFTVRSGETSSATELLGGLSTIVGGGAGGNADVLYEFIQSQEIIERIDKKIDLMGHYSAEWKADPLYSLWPGATIEDLLWFWKRMVRITYDKGTGLLMIEVRARDPEYARQIATLVVSESEAMINKLNETARRDGMANAQTDLDDAVARLRVARENMAKYRGRTQILDPQADIQGRMGVLNNLQQQLAEALVGYDLLIQTADVDDPRLLQLQRSVDVIKARIAEERRSFSAQNVTVDNTDYPALLAQYESLQVEQQFAEQTYRAALTAMDAARSNAARQQLYLAAYIQPTLAQRSEYPQRLLLMGLTLFFGLVLWSILALVYYSLRDRG